MSYCHPNGLDYFWMSLLAFVLIMLSIWISYAVWHGAHTYTPPQTAKQAAITEYDSDCSYNDGVPNTQVNPWTCTRP